jgi:general secretion pathway protein N
MLVLAVAAATTAWPARLAAAATDQAVPPDLRAVPRPPALDLDQRPSPLPAVQSGNPLWAVPLSALTATRDRPLFSASRRPPAPPVVASPVVQTRPPPPPAPGPQKPRMALVGTVAGVDGIAVFVDQGTQAIIRLRTGEGHEGWILRKVGTREVTLQNDQDIAILALPSVQQAK